jgi:deoxycytidylate deaminase
MNYMPITKRDNYFINVAYNEAQNSTMLMKHGACVVHNNNIVGRGCNSRRTQFKDKFIGVSCSCHAEMNALYNAMKNHKRGRSSTLPFSERRRLVLQTKGNNRQQQEEYEER